jgi:hypothetical protein
MVGTGIETENNIHGTCEYNEAAMQKVSENLLCQSVFNYIFIEFFDTVECSNTNTTYGRSFKRLGFLNPVS